MALWGARFKRPTAELMKEFSSSIASDARLWRVDIQTSKAHARMLTKNRILSDADGAAILKGLDEMADELTEGRWSFDPKAEDIHGEIERRLTEKAGEAARRLHTARSRNDQVTTDTRLYLSEGVKELNEDLSHLQQVLLDQAEVHVETLMPGMTHLQHAQPVSLAHHLLAYFWMFERDRARLQDSVPRILSCTLGAAALAGTGFPIDRKMTAEELGFLQVSENSLDSVSDRDYVLEFLSNASMIMMHLSRLCEELVLWSAPEFGFVEMSDLVTTGSSIMPQKKNPDAAELIRGRVGRVYGALMGALTMMKGLPLSYNRDLQEDKVHLFQAFDTVSMCLKVCSLMFEDIRWNPARMKKALKGDASNATDLADDLVEKGLSFRQAHEVVGELVAQCMDAEKPLEDLTLLELKAHHPLFDEKSVARLPHLAVLQARRSEGGTAPSAVRWQMERAKKALTENGN